jgi:guanine deaminase
MNKYMKIAYDEALYGIKHNEGGPFGAVIVKDDMVIAKAHNTVLKENDPTCHAEINAIKKASKKLKTYNLEGCILYVTGEPCPMCLSALIWAKIKEIYYGCNIIDTEKIGFIDKNIYNNIKKIRKKELKEIDRKDCLNLYKEWSNKEDKEIY